MLASDYYSSNFVLFAYLSCVFFAGTVERLEADFKADTGFHCSVVYLQKSFWYLTGDIAEHHSHLLPLT